MKKKITQRIIIILCVLALGFVVVNFGINFYLQQKLPSLVKNNTSYRVDYSSMKVDVFTGEIQVHDFKIATKNPNDLNVIRLQGTIKELRISRFGIWDAVFNKKINSSDVDLMAPVLQIRLAKPVDDKTGKARNPVVFRNIGIQEGTVEILRHTGQKFMFVHDLNLEVAGLQMTEKSVENKLPVVFDSYSIRGKDFFFRPDDSYAIKSAQITTESGKMSIKAFELMPMVSLAEFKRLKPQAPFLFRLKSREMNFKDIVLKNEKVSLSSVDFVDPIIEITQTGSKKEKKPTPFKYNVSLNDINLTNAIVRIKGKENEDVFLAENLAIKASEFLMDKNTSKATIPFSYKNFDISAEKLNYYTPLQHFKVANLQLTPNLVSLNQIRISPNGKHRNSTQLDLKLSKISLDLNRWSLDDNIPLIDAKKLSIEGLEGKVMLSDIKKQATNKNKEASINFSSEAISLTSPKLEIRKGTKSQSIEGIRAQISQAKINKDTRLKGQILSSRGYEITANSYLSVPNSFYRISSRTIKANKNSISISNFKLTPQLSRSVFISRIPTEKDLYDLSTDLIHVTGAPDLFANASKLIIDNIAVKGMKANIFRSKIPNDDLSKKPMYSALLRSIKKQIIVKSLNISDSYLEYEEDTKKSDGPGKLIFSDFSLIAQNINSGKKVTANTLVPIVINAQFMNVSPLNVSWNLNTADLADKFTIKGSITDLPASSINAFVEPYLKIQTTGYIKKLTFDYNGNHSLLNGNMQMVHENLKVAILKKEGDKDKLLSAAANLFIKTNSGEYPASVSVDNVERDHTKSFFNFFWQGLQEGLKKTLIGSGVEKKEETAKAAISTTKQTIDNIKEKVQTVKEKELEVNEKKPQRKKTRGIFKRKEKTAD